MKIDKIIKLCKKGKSEGFELLVYHYADTLMAICMRYLRDEDAAKDALQNCYISIFKNIQRYDTTGNFEAWIRKIAVNSSLKELRKNKKLVFSLDRIQEESFFEVGVKPKIYESFNENDIINLLNELPDQYRVVFNLYVVEAYSYREIAEMLDVTEANCRMKISRARNMLKKLLINQRKEYGFARTRKVD